MNEKYEGSVGNYSFIMEGNDTIEIWGDDLDLPESYIVVTPSSIKSKKDFDAEISFWWMKNFQ
jgi:hypothetical protein